MPAFAIGDTDFLLDGAPHQVISGAMHYFRVHPDQWADRIHKARLMGLNTIETYVAWNAHSPSEHEFITEGQLDLARFLDLIAAEGMHAIVRPGPYICAEWWDGGLPAWLLREPDARPRSRDPRFMSAVTSYLERVYAVIAPYQIDRGGPVVLVQIENEYAAYGSDTEYLAELTRVTRAAGITVPLTAIDQPEHMRPGSVPEELHLTASFGSRTAERFATLRGVQPTGPLMCMEFWDGWFDDWGSHHHTTSAEAIAAELDAILSAGGSVNIYMFHGGTNFGATNGANDKGIYRPITTSYDYDAPLDEAGNPTPKYFAFRDVIARHAAVPSETPAVGAPSPAFEVPLGAPSRLFDVLDDIGASTRYELVPTFDELAFDGALAVFRTTLAGGGLLVADEIRDRCWIFLDGAPVGILSREMGERAIELPRGGELTLLVEDQGRVDYGPRIGESKGIIGGLRLDGEPVRHWVATPLDLHRLVGAGMPGSRPGVGPSIRAAAFELDAATDLFVDTHSWGKGYAWLNGTLLGRYWRRGPQRTLYVPAPLTRAGTNVLTVLELEAMTEAVVRFVPGLLLGHTEF